MSDRNISRRVIAYRTYNVYAMRDGNAVYIGDVDVAGKPSLKTIATERGEKQVILTLKSTTWETYAMNVDDFMEKACLSKTEVEENK